MYKVSKLIMTVGGIISLLAMCCLNSEGIYFWYASLVYIMGGFIAGAGYTVYRLSDRQADISEFHQQDRLDGDVEYFTYDERGREIWTAK